MKIYKQDNRIHIQNGKKDEFIIGYFGSDLYWILPEYTEDNEFVITEELKVFHSMLNSIFNHMKKEKALQLNGTQFHWLSEARLPEESSTLTITKLDDKFIIRFIQNPNDYFAVMQGSCSICFCLSGSKNPSVATAFSITTHKLLARD